MPYPIILPPCPPNPVRILCDLSRDVLGMLSWGMSPVTPKTLRATRSCPYPPTLPMHPGTQMLSQEHSAGDNLNGTPK